MRTYLKICGFLVLHFSHFFNVAILLQSLKFQYVSKRFENLVNELCFSQVSIHLEKFGEVSE